MINSDIRNMITVPESIVLVIAVAAAVLVLFCIFLLIRLWVIKNNLKNIASELEKTRESDYDRLLRITLNDKDMNRMVTELNRNLDHQNELKLKEEAARKQMEQSVADIAHDLRTPLTVVKGNLQMLSEEKKLSEEGRQYLEVSARKTDTLKNMVDEFFELSVLESDEQTAKLEQVDIVKFLAQFIIDHETMIRDNGLTPKIDFPERAVIVNAKEELLGRVFSNLLTNICKYAKDSFSIRVDADTAEVIMSNSLSSSDEIDVEHIFDRTYRADKARREGSAGLGLYIAKLLMEKQNGRISAEIRQQNIYFTLGFSPIK